MTHPVRTACQMTDASGWIPEAAVHYLTHIEKGVSIRTIARGAGCHASTILRRVRRFENRRDDPLVDGALDRLSVKKVQTSRRSPSFEEKDTMNVSPQVQFAVGDKASLTRDTVRVLRRLAESGALLAVAKEMDKAVVMRDLPGGQSARTSVVDRQVAEVMALNEWISCSEPGRIARYRITSLGRAALKRMLAEDDGEDGLAEAQSPFAAQHRSWDSRDVADDDTGAQRKVKYNIAESPLTALARRKDKSGKPFLGDALVAAGERLREDFELAQMGARVTQNWERFLTAGVDSTRSAGAGPCGGPQEARARVQAALSDLGPGLGDAVLRCCCFLEGIEETERKMGWSARSGKIVLRIALQRLARHYEETCGKYAPMIG